MTDTAEDHQLWVNTAVKPLLLKKAQKMASKAHKLGMGAPVIRFGETVERMVDADTIGAYVRQDEKGKRRYYAMFQRVLAEGEAPVIGGYRYIATVDLTGSKPLVKTQPYFDGSVDLTPFHDTDGHCDHCNTQRARNDVLIIQNVETGELMQLGRNCANDFFGTKDALARVAVSDWAGAYGNVTDPHGHAEPTIPVSYLFTMAAAVVRTFGWVHHRDCKLDNTLQSTKGRVWGNLFPGPHMPAEDKVTITAEDRAEAEMVMDWLQRRFLDKPADECSDFERNVQAVCEGEGATLRVKMKNLNYLIWGIAGYKRDLQKEAEERRKKREAEERRKAGLSSQHLGTVGERRDFTMTLEFKRAFGSEYGVRYMQKFVDANDNVLVWWGTNDTAARTVVGETYTFTATVKAHEVYEDTKQTVLTRAKLVEGSLKEEDG